jgi:hypothetical protein
MRIADWPSSHFGFPNSDWGLKKKEKMNIEHSTLNIERRMKNKAGR